MRDPYRHWRNGLACRIENNLAGARARLQLRIRRIGKRALQAGVSEIMRIQVS